MIMKIKHCDNLIIKFIIIKINLGFNIFPHFNDDKRNIDYETKYNNLKIFMLIKLLLCHNQRFDV